MGKKSKRKEVQKVDIILESNAKAEQIRRKEVEEEKKAVPLATTPPQISMNQRSRNPPEAKEAVTHH